MNAWLGGGDRDQRNGSCLSGTQVYGSPSEVPLSSGNLYKMQILGPHPRPSVSDAPGGSARCVFKTISGDSDAQNSSSRVNKGRWVGMVSCSCQGREKRKP